MKTVKVTLLLLVLLSGAKAQDNKNTADQVRKTYLEELAVTGRMFTGNFYPNHVRLHQLPERAFIHWIDSARAVFNDVLHKHASALDREYVAGQQLEIKYYFDKILAEYPMNHAVHTGEDPASLKIINDRLNENIQDLNKPELLKNSDFTNYVKAFIDERSYAELQKKTYRNQDNQSLNAAWKLISNYVQDPGCRDFWRSEYLSYHIENNGIKNIDRLYRQFQSTCRDTAYLGRVRALYQEDSIGRTGHLIKTYKTAGPVKLDLHLFLPEKFAEGPKRPVIVMFHGGSWSEGKPDWFFASCESYAQKGWIACAVEYRTYGKNRTLPFEAVKDARSAVRWLRAHAAAYNLDTARVVATGNSAGGHLVLATAMADRWNEKTDDLRISPVPNLLLVNSGVFDLTDDVTAWIRKDLENKNQVKEISPLSLVRKNMPPLLFIHATNDRNVPYASAEKFAAQMKAAGNDFAFETLQGAGHFIWYDPKVGPEVSRLRTAFLAKYGY